MRNFARINNYHNKQQAWLDWNSLVWEARSFGVETEDLQPPEDAGWRTIDKQIAKLRERIKERESGST